MSVETNKPTLDTNSEASGEITELDIEAELRKYLDLAEGQTLTDYEPFNRNYFDRHNNRLRPGSLVIRCTVRNSDGSESVKFIEIDDENRPFSEEVIVALGAVAMQKPPSHMTCLHDVLN